MLRQNVPLGNDFMQSQASRPCILQRYNGLQRGRDNAAEHSASEIEDSLWRVDALPVLDASPEREILGYAEDGFPS